MKKLLLVPVSLLLLVLLAAVSPPRPPLTTRRRGFTRCSIASGRRRLKEDPLFATSVGRHEYDDRLPSVTMADLERRDAETQATLAELAAIDRAKLAAGRPGQLRHLQTAAGGRHRDFELGDYQMPFNADSGFHSGFSRLPKDVPLATVKDYENYISRLNAWPRYVREEIALMRIGHQARHDHSARDARRLRHDDHRAHRRRSNEERLLGAVREVPVHGAGIRAGATAAARGARRCTDGAVVGYREFLDFFRNEYLPARAHDARRLRRCRTAARTTRQQIREFTTLDLTPEEIHKIGLSEVERISGEMNAVIEAGRLQGRLRGLPRVPAHRSALLREDAARSC